jgi:PAS domain S-box-containing protein
MIMRPAVPWTTILPLTVLGAVWAVSISGWRMSSNQERQVVRLGTQLAARQVVLRLEGSVEARLHLVERTAEGWGPDDLDTPEIVAARFAALQREVPGLIAIERVDRAGATMWAMPGDERRRALAQHLADHPTSRPLLEPGGGEGGETRLTAILQTAEGRSGFAACIPLEAGGVAGDRLIAFFELRSLVEESLDRGVFELFGLSLHDGPTAGFVSGSSPPSHLDYGATNRALVGGREWTIRLTPRRRLRVMLRSPIDELFLGIGLVLGLVLANFARWLMQTHDRLEQSEQRFRTIFDAVGDAIFIYDLPGTPLVVNERACELTGHDRRGLLRLDPATLGAPDGAPESSDLAQRLEEVARDGRPQLFQWRARHRTGRPWWAEVDLRRATIGGEDRVIAVLRDITRRKQAERRSRLMMDELDHRVKNNLASVMTLADLTAATSGSLEEFLRSFNGRLRSMAHTHEALANGRWEGLDLAELVRGTMAPFTGANPSPPTVVGPELMLPARMATPLALVMHELATNAAKHGALSVATGHVEVRWAQEDAEGIRLAWRERGGPSPATEIRESLGLRLIRGLVEHEIGGAVRFELDATGLSCRVDLPLSLHNAAREAASDAARRPASFP